MAGLSPCNNFEVGNTSGLCVTPLHNFPEKDNKDPFQAEKFLACFSYIELNASKLYVDINLYLGCKWKSETVSIEKLM